MIKAYIFISSLLHAHIESLLTFNGLLFCCRYFLASDRLSLWCQLQSSAIPRVFMPLLWWIQRSHWSQYHSPHVWRLQLWLTMDINWICHREHAKNSAKSRLHSMDWVCSLCLPPTTVALFLPLQALNICFCVLLYFHEISSPFDPQW